MLFFLIEISRFILFIVLSTCISQNDFNLSYLRDFQVQDRLNLLEKCWLLDKFFLFLKLNSKNVQIRNISRIHESHFFCLTRSDRLTFEHEWRLKGRAVNQNPKIVFYSILTDYKVLRIIHIRLGRSSVRHRVNQYKHVKCGRGNLLSRFLFD